MNEMPEEEKAEVQVQVEADHRRNEAAVQKLAYTIKEAAALLNMSEKSVRRQIQRGNLRRCKNFGRVLIPRRDIERFYDKNSEYAA